MQTPHVTEAEMDARMALIEAQIGTPSPYIPDVENASVVILGLSVPTAAWALSVTSSINAMRNCLINHGFMAAS